MIFIVIVLAISIFLLIPPEYTLKGSLKSVSKISRGSLGYLL